jgi:hypothetical protein
VGLELNGLDRLSLFHDARRLTGKLTLQAGDWKLSIGLE